MSDAFLLIVDKSSSVNMPNLAWYVAQEVQILSIVLTENYFLGGRRKGLQMSVLRSIAWQSPTYAPFVEFYKRIYILSINLITIKMQKIASIKDLWSHSKVVSILPPKVKAGSAPGIFFLYSNIYVYIKTNFKGKNSTS